MKPISRSNKEKNKMSLTEEKIHEIIANKAYNTRIGKELLYRLYFVDLGIEAKNPSPSDLEKVIQEAESIANMAMPLLRREWVKFYCYRVNRTEINGKKFLTALKDISFIGWESGWDPVTIYSKEKIPSLKKFYIGVRKFMDTDIEYVYDDSFGDIIPRHGRDIDNIMAKNFKQLSKNLQKIFEGKKIPIKKLTDYEIKLIKTILWMDMSPCPFGRERQFEYVAKNYKILQPEIAFSCFPRSFIPKW